MKNRSHFARAGVMALTVGALATSAGCNQDKLLTVGTPDVVLPSDLTGPAALGSAYAAAIGDFQVAYAGSSSSEGQVIYSGLLSDEFMNAETFPTRIEVDRRTTNPINGSLLPIFQNAQRARATAELVSASFGQYDPANPNRAEVQALAGFVYVLFAENYCNGVPTSKVNADGSFTYGDPQTGAQLLTTAIAKFDSAITVATAAGTSGANALNLARIGKARAQLDQNQYAAAAVTAAAVPSTYAYNILADENTSRQYNAVFSYTVTSKRFTVGDREGGNGLPFVTLNDPRAPVVRTGNGFDNATPFYQPQKFTTRSSPTPLALGTEARLIEAEAALRAGDDATFLAKLNDARANAKTYAAVGTAAPASPAPITALAVAALTPTGKQDLLFQERALDLFLTSHRLGDLRRLIKYYSRGSETVFPTGAYNPVKGGTYGGDVNFPIPFEETNNPQYKACLDRAP
ncbi:MAG: RagB/SusD family nutrient uptake outer membrane protein [bacterium]